MRRETLVYVAAPYTDGNPDVTRQRLQIATRYAAGLLAQGRHAFSPLTYTHRIQQLGYQPPPPGNWYSFDLQFLRQCEALEILTLPGWRESYGVALETEHARRWGIPVRYVEYSATGADADLIPPSGPPPGGCQLDIPFGTKPPGLVCLRAAGQDSERTAGMLIAAGVAVFCPWVYRQQFQRPGMPDIPPARWQQFAAQMQLRCERDLDTDQGMAG